MRTWRNARAILPALAANVARVYATPPPRRPGLNISNRESFSPPTWSQPLPTPLPPPGGLPATGLTSPHGPGPSPRGALHGSRARNPSDHCTSRRIRPTGQAQRQPPLVALGFINGSGPVERRSPREWVEGADARPGLAGRKRSRWPLNIGALPAELRGVRFESGGTGTGTGRQ